jgi:hypothetical protein
MYLSAAANAPELKQASYSPPPIRNEHDSLLSTPLELFLHWLEQPLLSARHPPSLFQFPIACIA